METPDRPIGADFELLCVAPVTGADAPIVEIPTATGTLVAPVAMLAEGAGACRVHGCCMLHRASAYWVLFDIIPFDKLDALFLGFILFALIVDAVR